MNKTILVVKHRVYPAVVAILAAVSTNAVSAQEEAPDDGAYLFAAAGCQGCHTDVVHKGALLAGGRALTTPFGTFYTPNITADVETGIGGWSDEEFIRALRDGLSPSGKPLSPAFPYPARKSGASGKR